MPLKERPIQLNEYNIETRDNGNSNVIFELHPKDGRDITRVWTFEVNRDEYIWSIIKRNYETIESNFDNRNNENYTMDNSLLNPILEGQHIHEDL